ncbi:sensor histidine kinase [Antarcticirhabdus aurantiaca]|uniref:sensor histidine kinase n=1 Tax=Antarcticirhabdus aurantiaca TaxID=2606717 RepID=UPI00131ADD36|nr:sensor histidine kinase [Antarcticirhabdus aurantiaca]
MKLSIRTLPIRWHLLVFAVLILVPQLLLGLGLGWWYAVAEHRRVEEGAVALAATVSSQLDRELEATKAALQALAASPNVAAQDFGALREQALELLKLRGSMISVRDRDHRQVMNTLVPTGEPLPVNRDPAVVAADMRVFSTGEPTVSDLYTGALTGGRYVLVNVPLRVEGEVRYALNMAMAPEVIRGILANAPLPAAWTATVLDGNDRVVARSRDQERYIGELAPPSFTERAAEFQSGVVDDVRALDGTPVFTAYDTLEVTPWRVVVAVPRSVLNAPFRTLVLSLAAVIALVLATSVVLARLYSLRLEHDVRALQALAASTGTGRPADRTPQTVSELVTVASALREADASLHERNRHRDLLLAELNHRVRNTLSVLRSVVEHTIRSSGDNAALASKTSGRIMALSRAHDLLSHAEWSATALSELVARTAEQERLTMLFEGPEIRMRAEAVVPLAQALHELAVNQRLHGQARDQPVVLRVEKAGEHMHFHWILPDGEDPLPWTSGFGLRLVRLCLERQLFGRIERLDASGLYATLPMAFVTGEGLRTEPFAARWSERTDAAAASSKH